MCIRDSAKNDARVPMVTQSVADRRGDVPLGEDARRELIEQGLKQMVVRAVDNGDIDLGASQRLRRKQSAESAADDHDVMPAVWCRGSHHTTSRSRYHGATAH